jgi:hypothetical protein
MSLPVPQYGGQLITVAALELLPQCLAVHEYDSST